MTTTQCDDSSCDVETADHLGLVARKPVFGVSQEAILKPVSSSTETS